MLHTGGPPIMGAGRSFAPGMTTGVDGDDVLDDIFGLFDDTIGDEPNVKTTVVGRGRHDTSGRSTGSTTHRKNRPLAAVRKSPLSLPKTPVWRMLYIDPDVSDPKLVAGLLETTASRALRCGCVFDVATDIVEALADVRGDTMWAYRGVFINESLYRHKKLDHGNSRSIQGKHLSQFLRQVGMSGTRIVLLVAGDVHFDTADAGAHGLSAVLRKPFTKDGFCDILRGMYLSDDPPPAAPAPTGEPAGAQRKSAASYPCPTNEPQRSPPLLARHPSFAKGPIPPEGRPKVAGAVRPTGPAAPTSAAGPMVMHGGAHVQPPSAYPACLGFTPFPHSMINSYHLVSGLLRPGQNGPRRKYTKIAPKEEDEAAAVPAQALRASSPDPPAMAAVITTSVAANQAGHGVLPGSGVRTGVSLAASRDGPAAQDFPATSSPEDAASGVDNPARAI
ncbi:unnamed protein product [Laminaria digitata]